MESRLPKPTKSMPVNRTKTGLNLNNITRLPFSQDLLNRPKPTSLKRALSPDLKSCTVGYRPKLRRSRSVSDFRDFSCKREQTLAKIPAQPINQKLLTSTATVKKAPIAKVETSIETDFNSTICSSSVEIFFDNEMKPFTPSKLQQNNTSEYASLNNSVNISLTDAELTSNCSAKHHNRFILSPKMSLSKFCNSTPKFSRYENVNFLNTSPKNEGVLKEIDNFLMENNNTYTSAFDSNNISTRDLQPVILDSAVQNPIVHKSKINCSNTNHDTNYSNHIQDSLISLNEIWGQDAIQNIQEERFRRQHCEKTIQILQTNLFEYQQKISVAIKVDKTKDEALKKYHGINLKLTTTISQLEEQNLNLNTKIEEQQNKSASKIMELNKKIAVLQTEVAQTLTMLKKFQERNETLELKVESFTMASNEIRNINKAQIQDLEIRLSNSLHNETMSNEEVLKLKVRLSTIQTELDKETNLNKCYKTELDKAKMELEAIQRQMESFLNKSREEKSSLENLDRQKKLLQETIVSMNNKEKEMVKELESQRISLKSYYQTQLEIVVSKKLKEFQNQLDSVEENIKTEAKQRERTIVERAIQQMQIINEKNEEEFELVTAKHNEEIALYRIQLSNASKTIDSLNQKLETYQTRRADIAERLHNIMETQWQKALEIISSPSNSVIDEVKVDKFSEEKKTVNQKFQTPTSSFSQKSPMSYSDKLNTYIEILLKKSPRDLQLLEEIMRTPKEKLDNFCSTESRNGKLKPPWR